MFSLQINTSLHANAGAIRRMHSSLLTKRWHLSYHLKCTEWWTEDFDKFEARKLNLTFIRISHYNFRKTDAPTKVINYIFHTMICITNSKNGYLGCVVIQDMQVQLYFVVLSLYTLSRGEDHKKLTVILYNEHSRFRL